MRVLFVMGYPGYLRYYDRTVKLLAERGHEVTVVFEQPKKQEEGLRALDDADAAITVKPGYFRRSLIWDAVPRELRRVADWARYFDPRLSDAHYLRERSADLMTKSLQPLARIKSLPARPSRLFLKALLAVEHSIPPYKGALEFMASEKPDVFVVTPLITSASRQPDLVKAARVLGIPTVLGVASWDHLSSKGLIR